jgi:hypothetical protein
VVAPSAEGVARAGEPARSSSSQSGLTIRTAQLDKGGLTLDFSEAVRPPSSVDPGQFRLTFAYVARKHATTRYYYYETEAPEVEPWTVYSDLGSVLSRNEVEQLRPDRIRIPAGAGLDLRELCKDIAKAPPTQTQVGIYLHYAGSTAAPPVQSEAGTALGAIAPYWQRAGSSDAIVDGVLPGSPIPVKLTCR